VELLSRLKKLRAIRRKTPEIDQEKKLIKEELRTLEMQIEKERKHVRTSASSPS